MSIFGLNISISELSQSSWPTDTSIVEKQIPDEEYEIYNYEILHKIMREGFGQSEMVKLSGLCDPVSDSSPSSGY
jgi:hypothetical protein